MNPPFFHIVEIHLSLNTLTLSFPQSVIESITE